MASHAARGKTALDNKDYPAAIEHLTTALKESQSPLWLIQRSTAYQRSGQHELALADADNAVLAAISRSRRELIATAQFRRAIALHGMGRFGNARLCFNWCHKYNEKEKGLTMWVAKVKKDYDDAGGEDAEVNQTTVKEIPDKVEEVNRGDKGKGKEVEKNGTATKGKGKEVAAPVVAPTLTQTPKEKIREEFYQTSTNVTIEILAKGVPQKETQVEIQEGELGVSFPLGTGTYDYTITPLFRRVDPSKSSFRITPHKIEIILHKAVPGIKWPTLEGTEKIVSSATVPEDDEKIKAAVLEAQKEKEKAPAYPTSSRTGPKNWDKVVEDKADEDEEAGVDDFFKKLYKGSDDDTRRAMMKSYIESNGTSLSTNWDQVGTQTFQTEPPEGMEAKKWDS
ncbi:hypothetical protein G7Y89_g5598 [Cudoniella acicularis]|uniref:Uncharacterized protein n=1 Tax=Cudoniella acicularis TaxID=354080 RepID=A0A8H4RNK7_9HELO|nr:hypothetical protein G7Y89_g5598 [Cudoniella acicularis]